MIPHDHSVSGQHDISCVQYIFGLEMKDERKGPWITKNIRNHPLNHEYPKVMSGHSTQSLKDTSVWTMYVSMWHCQNNLQM